MLVAETRGKALQAIRYCEDYLTSSVFGHLRYLPPTVFWEALLSRARNASSNERSLVEVLAAKNTSIADYTSLQVDFWHYHGGIGEPDVILKFHADGFPTVRVIVEVKLLAEKSGTGENDQLAQYFKLLGPAEGPDLSFLLYLTPRESLAEIRETAEANPVLAEERTRMFRVRWQDVSEVARQQSRTASENHRTILKDVAKFLRLRELEYFDGFRSLKVPEFRENGGSFYQPLEPSYPPPTVPVTVSEDGTYEILVGAWLQ